MPDDAVYFGVGVDQAGEAAALVDTMQAHGFRVNQRVESQHFSAFDLHREQASAVRVVSARGVVLALDATLETEQLSLDPRTGTDLDADTLPDIVIVRTEPTRNCLALAHVDAEGYFRITSTDTSRLDGATCIEALRDVNNDQRIDALVPMRAATLGVEATVTVALTREASGPFLLQTEAVATYFADERARREALVMRAVDVADQHSLVRLACELAWLERLTQEDADASLVARVFDATVAHLPLSTDHAEQAQRARARLLQLDASLGATASAND